MPLYATYVNVFTTLKALFNPTLTYNITKKSSTVHLERD